MRIIIIIIVIIIIIIIRSDQHKLWIINRPLSALGAGDRRTIDCEWTRLLCFHDGQTQGVAMTFIERSRFIQTLQKIARQFIWSNYSDLTRPHPKGS